MPPIAAHAERHSYGSVEMAMGSSLDDFTIFFGKCVRPPFQ